MIVQHSAAAYRVTPHDFYINIISQHGLDAICNNVLIRKKTIEVRLANGQLVIVRPK